MPDQTAPSGGIAGFLSFLKTMIAGLPGQPQKPRGFFGRLRARLRRRTPEEMFAAEMQHAFHVLAEALAAHVAAQAADAPRCSGEDAAPETSPEVFEGGVGAIAEPFDITKSLETCSGGLKGAIAWRPAPWHGPSPLGLVCNTPCAAPREENSRAVAYARLGSPRVGRLSPRVVARRGVRCRDGPALPGSRVVFATRGRTGDRTSISLRKQNKYLHWMDSQGSALSGFRAAPWPTVYLGGL